MSKGICAVRRLPPWTRGIVNPVKPWPRHSNGGEQVGASKEKNRKARRFSERQQEAVNDPEATPARGSLAIKAVRTR